MSVFENIAEFFEQLPAIDFDFGTMVSSLEELKAAFLARFSLGWDYLDAISTPFVVAYKLYQNLYNKVDEKLKKANYIKIALLATSFTLAIVFTTAALIVLPHSILAATALAAVGFAIGAVVDWLSACKDLYHSALKLWDYEEYLECQLFKLDHINQQINDLIFQMAVCSEDKDKVKLEVLEKQLTDLKSKKTQLLEDFKHFTVYSYHNHYLKYDAKYHINYQEALDKAINKVMISNQFTTIGYNFGAHDPEFEEIKRSIRESVNFTEHSAKEEDIGNIKVKGLKVKYKLIKDYLEKTFLAVLNICKVGATLFTAISAITAIKSIASALLVGAFFSTTVGSLGSTIAIGVAIGIAAFLLYNFGPPLLNLSKAVANKGIEKAKFLFEKYGAPLAKKDTLILDQEKSPESSVKNYQVKPVKMPFFDFMCNIFPTHSTVPTPP